MPSRPRAGGCWPDVQAGLEVQEGLSAGPAPLQLSLGFPMERPVPRAHCCLVLSDRSLNQSKNGTESMVPHTEFQEQKPLPQPALTGGLQVGKANVI